MVATREGETQTEHRQQNRLVGTTPRDFVNDVQGDGVGDDARGGQEQMEVGRGRGGCCVSAGDERAEADLEECEGRRKSRARQRCRKNQIHS